MTIYLGFPVVQTGGQTYGQVATKILAVDRQPNFLSYGAPLAITLRKNKMQITTLIFSLPFP